MDDISDTDNDYEHNVTAEETVLERGKRMALIALPQSQTQKLHRNPLSTRQDFLKGSTEIKKRASD
jgi:hypothetical protein